LLAEGLGHTDSTDSTDSFNVNYRVIIR
jgi:hypothetical protein